MDFWPQKVVSQPIVHCISKDTQKCIFIAYISAAAETLVLNF